MATAYETVPAPAFPSPDYGSFAAILGNLANTNRKAQSDQNSLDVQNAFKQGGLPTKTDGSIDYTAVANTLAKAGDPNAIASLGPLATQQQQTQSAQSALQDALNGLSGNGASSSGGAAQPASAQSAQPASGGVPTVPRVADTAGEWSVGSLVSTVLPDTTKASTVAGNVAKALGVDPGTPLDDASLKRARQILGKYFERNGAQGWDNTPEGHDQYNRAYAKMLGLEPQFQSSLTSAEGNNPVGWRTPNEASAVDVKDGKAYSFGDFQFNVRNGLGVDARKAGIDPADPSQWTRANAYAMDTESSGGLGPWKGDRAVEALRAQTARAAGIPPSAAASATPTGYAPAEKEPAPFGNAPQAPAQPRQAAPAPEQAGQPISKPAGPFGALTQPMGTVTAANLPAQPQGAQSPTQRLAGAMGPPQGQPQVPAPAPQPAAAPQARPQPPIKIGGREFPTPEAAVGFLNDTILKLSAAPQSPQLASFTRALEQRRQAIETQYGIGARLTPQEQIFAQWKKENPGATAQEEMSFLQTGKGRVTSDQVRQIVDGIESGDQPPVLTGMYGSAPAVRAELAKDGFNLTKSQLEWQAAQKQVASLNGPQMERFSGLATSVVNTIDEVKDLSEQMRLSGVPLLNKAELAAYIQTEGNSANGQLATRYVTAVGTLKEEFANLANGGYAPTEPAWHLAEQQINGNYGVKQLGASLGEVQRLINYRMNAIPGFSTMGPRAANPYMPGSGQQPAAAAATAAQGQGGPARISTKEDYDALPKGTQYVAPDGSVRTKQ